MVTLLHGYMVNHKAIWPSNYLTIEFMSVRLRLQRTGKKNQPSYRIVVADKKVKRSGKVIEVLGLYNPLTEPATIKVNRTRFDYWLSVGAQPSDTVRRLILGQKRKRAKVKKK